MKETVLLVDDSAQMRESLKDALRNTFSAFVEAEDGLSAIKAFVEKKPGFIITDVEMPSIDGYRFIKTIREMEDGRDVPIILLSGARDSLQKKLTGFNLGASDFLIKPFDGPELEARVRSLIKIRDLLNELREKNSLLEKLATTDELTGLYNRRHFFNAVKDQMSLGLRHGFKIACMLIDIDNFKKINDTWGHVAGDDVLRKAGHLLKVSKRDGEILARFGGEEFVLCLFNTNRESSERAAERFLELVRSHDFSGSLYPSLRITVSIGLAVYPQEAIESIDDLLRAADKAMYRSKAEGKDRVTTYEWDPAKAENDPHP
jgi:diguanylate cyclase (GGDEF)-like protein